MELSKVQETQLQELGITVEQLEQQLKAFREGFPFAELVKPATVGDGIIKPSDKDLNNWISYYNEHCNQLKITKFVPASGAASRMFKSLFEFLNEQKHSDDTELLLKYIEKFPFYRDLQQIFSNNDKNLESYLNLQGLPEIIRTILFENGLNYGNLPKGLLKFHDYIEGARTAVEEHLVESLSYASGKGGVNIHFTISKEHESGFIREFKNLEKKYATEHKFKLAYSFQRPSTNTLAVDMDNNPLLDEEGRFIFRPGGHGALLENLNDIDSDIIFIKNIDNIAPDRLKPITYRYKKALAGLALKVKSQINEFLNYLEWHDTYSVKKKFEISEFMQLYLGIKVPDNLPDEVYAGYIKSKLDKPVRICGMVKNTGEPGGGPYWVLNKKGELTLQIIESSQVNLNNPKQKEIFYHATHFNPVDLVCLTKDFAGNKFNLLQYRDLSAGFITEKSHLGKKIKVQELPGLWNGSMAHWITIFVEVPIETFTPVKTFTDWLRPEHQNK